MDKLKFLVVGDFISSIHEQAVCNALETMGVDVEKFVLRKYFQRKQLLFRKFYNFQKKRSWGPSVWKINRDLRRWVNKESFDCIFFYRPVFIKKKTLSECSGKSVVYFYNNDDPFSSHYPKRFWKDFFAGLPYCTHIFYYREKNRQDYINAGYHNISLLRSYFIRTLNFKMDVPKKFDVIFIGHYENDGRDEWIKYLLEQGISLKLYGPEWHRSNSFNYFTKKMGPIAALGKDYNKVINEAKIALVFLSTLNSDTYTRRCFEIPATGTFMLSQYSADLAGMFEEGKDADYFRSKEELKEKIRFYLVNEKLREQIARNGYDRVNYDKHEVTDRVKIVMNQLAKDQKAGIERG